MEFVKAGTSYDITGIDLGLAKFFYREPQMLFQDLAAGDYTISTGGGKQTLTITNPELLAKVEAFQVAYVLDFDASKYDTQWNVDINTLKDKYNQLLDVTFNVWEYIRKIGFVADDTDMQIILPQLNTGEVWVKTDAGWRGLNVGDIESNINAFWIEFNKKTQEILEQIVAAGKVQEGLLEDFTQQKIKEINEEGLKLEVTQVGHGFIFNAVQFDKTTGAYTKADVNTGADGIAVRIDDDRFYLSSNGIIEIPANAVDSKGNPYELDEYYFLDNEVAGGCTPEKPIHIFQALFCVVNKKGVKSALVEIGDPIDLNPRILVDEINSLGLATTDQVVLSEPTIADLIASKKYKVGDVVQVLGYYSAGDGAGHKRQKKPVEYNGVDATIGADGSIWGIVHSGEVNVSWFGAKGDGVTDDTTSLNNAINFAKNISSVVRLGESHYITSKLSLFLDNDNDFGNRINIVGNGSGNSKIFTNMNIPCLEIKSKGSVNNHSYMKLEGFRIFKSGGSLIGTGIIMDNIAYAHFNDLIVENFKFGIDGSDTLSSIYTNCIFRGNDYGLNLYRIDSSRPNALNFVSCIITGNNTWGMQVLGGSLLNMSGGSVEGNAIRNTGTGAKGGILLNDMGNEGSVGAIFTGVYFEYNKGNADVYMTTSTQGKVSYCFSGCSFNRIDKDIYTTNNILLESNTPCVLSMNGNGFKSFNNYIPSAERKTVKLGSLNNNYTIEDTNYYYDLIDKPDYNVVPCGFLSTPIALLSYNGSTGIVTKEYGVSAIEKQAIGTYVVTLNKEMPDEQPIVILSVKDSAIKSCSYTVLSKNSIAVYGYTDSGASSDLEFSLCVYV